MAYKINLHNSTGLSIFFDNVIDKLAPSCWCQNTMAIDKNGEPVAPSSPHAVRWCIQGAIIRLHSQTEQILDENVEPVSFISVSNVLRRALRIKGDLNGFNDRSGLSHREMIAELLRANDRIREGEYILT